MSNLPPLPKPIETGVMHQRRYIGSVFTPDQMREYAKAAVLAEREACAQLVENYALQYADPVWALKIVNAIRARSTHDPAS